MIQTIDQFGQKLNRLAFNQKMSEGAILLKFMRDFLENSINQECSLVDNLQDIE